MTYSELDNLIVFKILGLSLIFITLFFRLIFRFPETRHLEEMLHLEFMEMIKRGIRIKRCTVRPVLCACG